MTTQQLSLISLRGCHVLYFTSALELYKSLFEIPGPIHLWTSLQAVFLQADSGALSGTMNIGFFWYGMKSHV